MVSTVRAVREAFTKAIQSAFPGPISEGHDAVISTSDPKFGDYQCNSAMALFKKHKALLGEKGMTSPKAVGEAIQSHLAPYVADPSEAEASSASKLFAKAATAPQGFVTVILNGEWLANALLPFVTNPITYTASERMNVLVDMSSPNIAKDMHVGHLRSTIIGESTARILEFSGHDVMRANHLGDWGTQFGMLIEYIRDSSPDFLANPPTLSELCTLYVAAKNRFDADPAFADRARAAVVKLQGGDEYARSIWSQCVSVSMKDFNEIYRRLDFHAEERGESFYNSRIPACVEYLEKRKLVEESEGAKVLFTVPADKRSDNDFPLIVVKNDGGYGYDSTDLTAIRYRLEEMKRNWVIYITDAGQAPHFDLIFRAAELAGWHKPPQTRCSHVGFGHVKSETGKKFASRSGGTVKLSDVLDEAVSRARAEIDRRYGEDNNDNKDKDEDKDGERATTVVLTDQEKQHAAECLGYSAVKYFDMRQNLTTDYKFSYDLMLDPKGNTATYLMYAYARICAIFRKAGKDRNTFKPGSLKVTANQERALLIELLRLFEVLDQIHEDLDVSRLTKYTYSLCGEFTVFYSNCRVIGDENEDSRLALCQLTLKFLELAFHLIGIKALERL